MYFHWNCVFALTPELGRAVRVLFLPNRGGPLPYEGRPAVRQGGHLVPALYVTAVQDAVCNVFPWPELAAYADYHLQASVKFLRRHVPDSVLGPKLPDLGTAPPHFLFGRIFARGHYLPCSAHLGHLPVICVWAVLQ